MVFCDDRFRSKRQGRVFSPAVFLSSALCGTGLNSTFLVAAAAQVDPLSVDAAIWAHVALPRPLRPFHARMRAAYKPCEAIRNENTVSALLLDLAQQEPTTSCGSSWRPEAGTSHVCDFIAMRHAAIAQPQSGMELSPLSPPPPRPRVAFLLLPVPFFFSSSYFFLLFLSLFLNLNDHYLPSLSRNADNTNNIKTCQYHNSTRHQSQQHFWSSAWIMSSLTFDTTNCRLWSLS